MNILETIKQELLIRRDRYSVSGAVNDEVYSTYTDIIEFVTSLELKNKKFDSYFLDLASSLRTLWPAGSKVVVGKNGSTQEYSWRDSVQNLAIRLEKLWQIRSLDKIPVENCVSVARRYLSKFETSTKYMQTLKYFILRQNHIVGNDGHIKYINESKFADMLEGKAEEDAVQNEWENLVNDLTYGEGRLV